jgi:hypothetical protein
MGRRRRRKETQDRDREGLGPPSSLQLLLCAVAYLTACELKIDLFAGKRGVMKDPHDLCHLFGI